MKRTLVLAAALGGALGLAVTAHAQGVLKKTGPYEYSLGDDKPAPPPQPQVKDELSQPQPKVTEQPAESPKKELTKEELAEAQCRSNIECYAEKHLFAATTACRPRVEALAKNNFEWADGWLDLKFSHYRWRSGKKVHITYVGDKIKFQNGFGAWIYHIYECDYDPISEKAVDARARPKSGSKLPD